MTTIRSWFRACWDASRPLTATGTLMLIALLGSLVGLLVDDRVIGGAPAWLKPAKFAISTAIYAFTFAWLFTYLPEWRRLKAAVGWITAGVLVLEVAIIDLQAVRGTTSHFNLSTPLDKALFATMGIAILIAWAVSVALTVALFRQSFSDRAMGWAIRLGMVVTVLGSISGGLMTRPAQQQLDAARAGDRMAIVGSHTVGAADGGPGLPGTGWSREHGDLRVPHFLGLHGAQIIPFVSWAFGRRRAIRSSTVVAIAASYASLFLMLLWQAQRGQSVVNPDGTTILALAGWAAGTGVAIIMSLRQSEPRTRAAAVVAR